MITNNVDVINTIDELKIKLNRFFNRCTELEKENAALKEGKRRYRHLNGNEYTVIADGVVDEAIGPDAIPDVVYVGKDGIVWRRPMDQFYGYVAGTRRFTEVEE